MTMMMLALLLAAAASSAPAQPSFDCGRARSSVEKMICADTDLAMSDRAMAYFYARRTRRNPPFQTHAQWLAQRNACADVACIRDSYETHVLDLAMGARLSRPYRTRDGEGSLILGPLRNGWQAFYVQSIHSNRDAMGANVADDEGAGAVFIQGGRGVWRGVSGCTISFTQRPRGWQVEKSDQCGGPLYASINGTYRR
jgi:uncharacterized protein YecT (DUF1311 family)